jgi:hypothetical protein
MALTIFHQDPRRVVRAERGKKSAFGHLFGGAADYSGLVANKRQPAVHLLFRLNTDDPLVGVDLGAVRWLPLLCAIRYGACGLGYRVTSDDEVEILHQKETKAWDDFPYDGYPQKLPARALAMKEEPYNPRRTTDALVYAGIFGYDHLNPSQFSKLARFIEKRGFWDPNDSDYESAERYLREGNPWPFVQGPPECACPEPKCPNHGRPSSLRTFAIFEEEEQHVRKLWGPDCGSLQIIYQVCPECSAIVTCNQCT